MTSISFPLFIKSKSDRYVLQWSWMRQGDQVRGLFGCRDSCQPGDTLDLSLSDLPTRDVRDNIQQDTVNQADHYLNGLLSHAAERNTESSKEHGS